MRTYWGEIIEIYKARMAVGLALVLAMVTLTEYGLTSRRYVVFLVAAAIPAFGLIIDDLVIKYCFSAPFLYKALTSEVASGEAKPMTMVFLEYGSRGGKVALPAILEIDDPRMRRLRFRQCFVLRGLGTKGVLCAAGSIGEVALWIYSVLVL